MKHSIRLFFALFVILGSLVSLPAAHAQSSCFVWSGQITLQTAVNQNVCVEIQPGTYTLTAPVEVPSGHTLRGTNRDTTVVRAVAPWSGNLYAGVINSPVTVGATVVVSTFTVDGNSQSILGVAARALEIGNMRIKGARCSGITIVGPNMNIHDNIIESNGASCPTAPPGAGIYAAGDPSNHAPVIERNTIQNNIGPGLDADGVLNGIFRGNTVTNNSSWAGVSLYGSSGWLVENNTIRHPNTNDVQPYHPACVGGPAGGRSAGIFLCQDTDANNRVTINNTIRNNQTSGWYGILSIGKDETQPYLAPRNNTFTDNNVLGSNYGCADDFQPGQWFTDQNTWTGNNCAGTPNTGPGYF